MKVGVTVVDFVAVALGETDFVAVALGETVRVGEGVPVGDAPGEMVPLLLGVGLGEGSTMPCTYMPAPESTPGELATVQLPPLLAVVEKLA